MFNDKELFFRLNETLKNNNLNLSIICVGGFVLKHYDMRETIDIDAFFTNNKKIEKIIKTVGDELNVNPIDELWLNNNVQNLNDSPSEDICDVIYNFSNLKVLIPPLIYIAGMKLNSMREEDIDDVALIIKKLGIKDIEKFNQELVKYDFKDIDEALIAESFERAYGMEWLEKYYIDHEILCLENVKKSNGFYNINSDNYNQDIQDNDFELAYSKYKSLNTFSEVFQNDIPLNFMKEVVKIHNVDTTALNNAVLAVTDAEKETPDFTAKLMQATLQTNEYKKAFEREQGEVKIQGYTR